MPRVGPASRAGPIQHVPLGSRDLLPLPGVPPMDTRTAGHPTAAVLQAYGLGKLADSTVVDSVMQHLETCAECRQKAGAVSADSFVQNMRDARSGSSTPIPTRQVSDIARAM